MLRGTPTYTITDTQVLTQREARLRKFYLEQDDGWSFKYWPLWVQRLILTKHKKYNDRYVLFRFLVYNGFQPDCAIQYIKLKDVKFRNHNVEFVEGFYDNAAEAQFQGMKRQWQQNTLIPDGTKMYSMHEGKVVIFKK